MNERMMSEDMQVAAENTRLATDYVDEKLDMDPTGLGRKAELPGGGYAKKVGPYDEGPEGASVYNLGALDGGTSEAIGVNKHGDVTSDTSATLEDNGTHVQYRAKTSLGAGAGGKQGVKTDVYRSHTDPETGETTHYHHRFKSPEAAKMVTKLAMNRIDGRAAATPVAEKEAA